MKSDPPQIEEGCVRMLLMLLSLAVAEVWTTAVGSTPREFAARQRCTDADPVEPRIGRGACSPLADHRRTTLQHDHNECPSGGRDDRVQKALDVDKGQRVAQPAKLEAGWQGRESAAESEGQAATSPKGPGHCGRELLAESVADSPTSFDLHQGCAWYCKWPIGSLQLN